MTGTLADRKVGEDERSGAGSRPTGAPRPRGRARNHKVQNMAARLSRGITRRKFISGASAFATGSFAALLIGREVAPAVAHTGVNCVFPCGRQCSGCTASAGCPSGYQNCYRNDYFDPNNNCCIYTSSYWYAGTYPYRHRCRDCRIVYCPCCCTSTCCAGFCGCRSTNHY